MSRTLLNRAPTLLAVTLLFAGCNQNTSNAPASQTAAGPQAAPGSALAVRAADSPAGADSRVIMSWVEKRGEKGHALRFAARDAAGWSEARTVVEGGNWFVNWADFPSVIALADGSLAAHWLVKSGAGTYAYDVNVARSGDGGKT